MTLLVCVVKNIITKGKLEEQESLRNSFCGISKGEIIKF